MAHLTKLKQHVWRTVMLVLTCLCALPVNAAIINYTPPEGEKISFTVLTTEKFWKNTENYSEAESLSEAGGTTWKSFGFKYNGNGLISGLNMDHLTAMIWNTNPIRVKISTLAIPMTSEYVDENFCNFNLTKIVLEISESADFSQSIVSTIETPFNGIKRGVFEFKIDEPKENLYYRVSFPMTKYNIYTDWLKIEQIIGCEAGIDTPVLTANDEKTEYSVVSTTGDLHMLLARYDSDGTLIEEIEGADEGMEAPAKVPADDDTSWRNKVRSINEEYTFEAPEENQYLVLRAKTVAGTTQSGEISNIIRKEGVLTGATHITAMNETENIRWFNLQGCEVTSPEKGIYIRVKGGNAKKISF